MRKTKKTFDKCRDDLNHNHVSYITSSFDPQLVLISSKIFIVQRHIFRTWIDRGATTTLGCTRDGRRIHTIATSPYLSPVISAGDVSSPIRFDLRQLLSTQTEINYHRFPITFTPSVARGDDFTLLDGGENVVSFTRGLWLRNRNEPICAAICLQLINLWLQHS